MESLRQAVAEITQNTEKQTTISPAERLVELLSPTLGKPRKKFCKQHINIFMKLTYRKNCESKHENILQKSKEKYN